MRSAAPTIDPAATRKGPTAMRTTDRHGAPESQKAPRRRDAVGPVASCLRESGGDSASGRRAVKDLPAGLAVTAHIPHHGAARRNPVAHAAHTPTHSHETVTPSTC